MIADKLTDCCQVLVKYSSNFNGIFPQKHQRVLQKTAYLERWTHRVENSKSREDIEKKIRGMKKNKW